MDWRWTGEAHDREHERLAEAIRKQARDIERVRLTAEERRAIQAAASRLVADEAIAANRLRRQPIWRDRRAVIGLGFQAVVAVVAVAALMHTINPALP